MIRTSATGTRTSTRCAGPPAPRHPEERGTLARGIDRQAIFLDDADRDALSTRLATLAHEKAFCVYAWALIPNHFHLVLRTHVFPSPAPCEATCLVLLADDRLTLRPFLDSTREERGRKARTATARPWNKAIEKWIQ